MSDNPTEVYRTTDPELLAAWDVAAEKYRKWVDEVGDFCEQHSGDRRYYSSSIWGERYFDGPLAPVLDDDLPIGWRRDRKHPERMLPNRRTPEGRELAKQMDGLRRAPTLSAALAGMPRDVQGPGRRDGSFTSHSCGAERRADDIEVTWGIAVPADKVDERWTKIALSQWHGERERAADDYQDGDDG